MRIEVIYMFMYFVHILDVLRIILSMNIISASDINNV